MQTSAKLFTNGRSQAVRLPAQYRFEGKEVYIRKDPETGDVILSSKPDNWDGFFTAMQGVQVPEDFLSPSERGQSVSDRDPFADWRA